MSREISLEFLERCSAETGFQMAALEKVVRLGGLVDEISRHPLLSEVLLLKGGTALNLGFGPPGRLSVDLDYNYVGASERAAMTADRPRVEEAVLDLASRIGYRLQRSRDHFAGRKLHLNFRSALGQESRIEVDLNFLYRVPLVEPATAGIWQPGGLDPALARIVGVDELVAGKLLALLDRCAPRDAWDVANLPHVAMRRLEDESFRRRFIVISGVLAHPVYSYSRARLESRITQRRVDESLAPMLVHGSRSSAEQLVDHAWERVRALVELTEEERLYVDELGAGRLRTELLFPGDPEAIARFATHPALRWKAQNAANRGPMVRDSESRVRATRAANRPPGRCAVRCAAACSRATAPKRAPSSQSAAVCGSTIRSATATESSRRSRSASTSTPRT